MSGRVSPTSAITSGGISPSRYAPLDTPSSGALGTGSSVFAAPPTAAFSSSTQTFRPRRASITAAMSPLCPAPTITASGMPTSRPDVELNRAACSGGPVVGACVDPMAEPLSSSTPSDAPAGPALEVIPAGSGSPARTAWWLVVPFALAPIVLAVLQLGRWHPDEVYQFLEPAWFRVHGYGVRAWEWQVGLRNWFAPLVFAFFLQIAHALGIDHPRVYRAVLALPQLALHGAMLAAAYRYVARRLASHRPPATWLAFTLFASFAPLLYFGGRTMGESLSTAFLVLACDALDREDDRAHHGALGGFLVGLAVVVRYGSA